MKYLITIAWIYVLVKLLQNRIAYIQFLTYQRDHARDRSENTSNIEVSSNSHPIQEETNTVQATISRPQNTPPSTSVSQTPPNVQSPQVRQSSPQRLNYQIVNRETTRPTRTTSLVSIPERKPVKRTPDTFPRCPRCRCSNRLGRPQVVFFDREKKCFRCHNGHLFVS